MSSFASLIPALFALMLAIAMITSAIIAHRGKPFWATWMMLVGSISALLGAAATIVAAIFLIQALSSYGGSTSSSRADTMTLYGLISGIGSLISLASMLAYLVGLLGLSIRYAALNKRITELETITDSLMENQPPR